MGHNCSVGAGLAGTNLPQVFHELLPKLDAPDFGEAIPILFSKTLNTVINILCKMEWFTLLHDDEA